MRNIIIVFVTVVNHIYLLICLSMCIKTLKNHTVV